MYVLIQIKKDDTEDFLLSRSTSMAHERLKNMGYVPTPDPRVFTNKSSGQTAKTFEIKA
jgi:hypothetical protein